MYTSYTFRIKPTTAKIWIILLAVEFAFLVMHTQIMSIKTSPYWKNDKNDNSNLFTVDFKTAAYNPITITKSLYDHQIRLHITL